MFLKLDIAIFALALIVALTPNQVVGKTVHKKAKARAKDSIVANKPTILVGLAEARLLDIYRLIGKSENQSALSKAEQLVRDFPTFALAQLVYGDLLSARIRPVMVLGDVPTSQIQPNAAILADLRTESQVRLKALKERPPAGAVPSEFLLLSARSKHAIAVDASRSRLYLFENGTNGLTLVADYYISVGKLGVEKKTEGDLRTPLGVYYITSQLDPKTLKDFYGAGALPINYPNALDLRRGKTGTGIWLHGSPPGQFSRAPQASEGCVVLANPDLENIINQVAIRSTPVIISKQINWVMPQQTKAKSDQFESRLNAWQNAKSSGNILGLNTFYAADFSSGGKKLDDWLPTLHREVARAKGHDLEIKDLSLLHWQDTEETMVVTFGEVATGQRTGSSKRQYWSRREGLWTIFYEGAL